MLINVLWASSETKLVRVQGQIKCPVFICFLMLQQNACNQITYKTQFTLLIALEGMKPQAECWHFS